MERIDTGKSKKQMNQRTDFVEWCRGVIYKNASRQIFGREIGTELWPDRETRVTLLKQWAELYYSQNPDYIEDPIESEEHSTYSSLHTSIRKDLAMIEINMVSVALLS